MSAATRKTILAANKRVAKDLEYMKDVLSTRFVDEYERGFKDGSTKRWWTNYNPPSLLSSIENRDHENYNRGFKDAVKKVHNTDLADR